MGLEYNLGEISEAERLQGLRISLAPRHRCREYVTENGGVAELVKREEFDDYAKKGEFVDGPCVDSFGDDFHEPFNPRRQSYGKLKDGRVVFCEMHSENQRSVRILFEKIDEKK